MGVIDRVTSAVGDQQGSRGHYAVAGVITLMFAGLWVYEGHYVLTAWIPELYDEATPINGVMAGSFMTLMLVCSVTTLVAPRRWAGAGRVVLVGGAVLGATMAVSFVQSEPLYVVVLLTVTVGLLALFVRSHPSRDSVVPGIRGVDRVLLVLTVLVAVPFLWLAVDFLYLQITLDDAIAQRWFYGGYAMYLTAVLALGVVASLDGTYRHFVAVAVAFLGLMLGLVSVVYPTELHSLGLLGGGLLLGWSAALVGWVRWIRPSTVDSGTS